MELDKPDVLHDRDTEWATLSEFATDPRRGATLGLVYGRRRQGKTLLLELLTEATGGFFYTGQQQSSAQNLREISQAYARYVGMPNFVFAGWREAIEALLTLGERSEAPVPVVVDEFSYLLHTEPGLSSILQTAISPRSRARRQGGTRLILCGSAVSTMRGLLAAGAPLRGRSALELLVHPFDYRATAAFWGLSQEPDIAFRLHALVGGTPAYRDMAFAVPQGPDDFDRWVVRRLLDQTSAMYREGALLLAEEPELADSTLYLSVLNAISRGATRRSEIASALDRQDSGIGHPLSVLEHVLLVGRTEDAFRKQRTSYRILEPIIRFTRLVIAPNEPRLVAGAGAQVWSEAADTVTSQIYGPHLEDLARAWCARYASQETLGGTASQVQPAVLACRSCKAGHQLDIVVTDIGKNTSGRVTAIGEVKATGKRVDTDALTRLDHIRELLPDDRVTDPPKLLMVSRTGFAAHLVERARKRTDVELIDLARLYQGE